LLFKAVARVHPRFKTPSVSIVVTAVLRRTVGVVP